MTNEEAIKELIDVLLGYPMASPRYEALEMAIESLKNKPDYDIIFLCDGKACGEDHDCMECRHTLDICHAKNFHYNPVHVLSDKNYYLEVNKTGKWINHRNDYGHNIADCSECGKTMQWHDEDEDGIPRYCWFCGAEMKEADNARKN